MSLHFFLQRILNQDDKIQFITIIVFISIKNTYVKKSLFNLLVK